MILSSGILFSSFDVSANFGFSYFFNAPASPLIEYWCCSEHLTATDHAIGYKEDFLAKLGAGYIVFGNVLGWSVFTKNSLFFVCRHNSYLGSNRSDETDEQPFIL